MIKKIDDKEKEKPVYASFKKIETTFFRTISEKKKGQWVYKNEVRRTDNSYSNFTSSNIA